MANNQNGPYIGKWITVLYRLRHSFYDRCFAEYGFGGSQFLFLLALSHREGATQDEISKHLNVDKATTARALAGLEKLGYVRRETSPDDLRAYKVFLTEQGRSLEPKIQIILRQWAGLIMEGFTPDEQKSAYDLLERMAQNAVTFRFSQPDYNEPSCIERS
ncbi:Hypothetical protein LUCI_1167 [Lucifera butyrica]|uniref:HTH marR-type domain-containing protein n=1 Tax=Lucifera butyrica TaxID=1351585 RepID=A0A498R0C3_9FIRM|nr:MarR family transcriptional regulator [Lucifera butyrica]VBB05956.1 Hypothetical protein LUCI_1167 [Lucifera butyrica]